MAAAKHLIEVFGLIKDAEFYQAKVTAEGLSRSSKEQFEEPKCSGMISYQWIEFLEEKKRELGGQLWTYKDNTMIFVDGVLIGSAENFITWVAEKFDYKDLRPIPLFHALAKEEYKQALIDSQHEFIYLTIAINKELAGQILIELFNDLLPRTCENFKQLCIGEMKESEKHDPPLKLSYQNSIIHRVVKNGWIQGGDFIGGKGDSGWSIYGETFEDENYAIRHSKRGIIGMANKGRHSNASQFYITLQAAPWMDYQYVAFGQVVEGLDILDKLEAVETFNERPITNCVITACDVFNVRDLYT